MKYVLLILSLRFIGCDVDENWLNLETEDQAVAGVVTDTVKNDTVPDVIQKYSRDSLYFNYQVKIFKLKEEYRVEVDKHKRFVESQRVATDSVKFLYFNKLDSMKQSYNSMFKIRQAKYEIEILKLHDYVANLEIKLQKKMNHLSVLQKRYTELTPEEVKYCEMGKNRAKHLDAMLGLDQTHSSKLITGTQNAKTDTIQ